MAHSVEQSPPRTSAAPAPPLDPAQVAESLSDNDANEKDARDRLRQTTLASMSRPKAETTLNQDDKQETVERPMSNGAFGQYNAQGESPRGRTVRKRSFDGSDQPEPEVVSTEQDNKDVANGHARKRSRDVHSLDTSRPNSRAVKPLGTSLHEDIEEIAEMEHTDGLQAQPSVVTSKDDDQEGNEATMSVHDQDPKHVITEGNMDKDQEMKEGSVSPRRKRSREHLDSDAVREQKIAATEEARAQRRSDEINRIETGVSIPKNGSKISDGHSSIGSVGQEADDNSKGAQV